ncbi:MAG: ATP synthase F1 subunit epsilon, partial [Cyanobacteria bacterium REEB65]|nr:ATP synthase F1 subunit epsilon [Cyanobacteria bacterium REEB65]
MPLTLEILTPERAVLHEDFDFVQVRGKEGELGILPGHTPLFTALADDLLIARRGEHKEVVTVMGGFMEVCPDRVTVLTPAAERAAEIDELRAKQAAERARLQVDRERTAEGIGALDRALVRLRAVEMLGHAFRTAHPHPGEGRI